MTLLIVALENEDNYETSLREKRLQMLAKERRFNLPFYFGV